MRARAATRRENLAEWRQRMLAAFTRLHDRAAQRAAAAEIAREVDDLDAATLPVFVAMLLDSCTARSVTIAHESFRLLALTAAAHGDAVRPYVPKIVAAAVRALKEPDATSGARETVAEALGVVARYVSPDALQQQTQQDAESHVVLGVFLRPLFALLSEQDKGFQTGAILAISAVITNSKLEHVLQDMPRLMSRLLDRMCRPGTQVHALIFAVVGRIADVVGDTFVPFVPQVLPLAITCLDCPDWPVRKAAADLMRSLVLRLGPTAMAAFSSEMHRALVDHRFDRVPPVREAIAAALRANSGDQLELTTAASASFSVDTSMTTSQRPHAAATGRSQQKLSRTAAVVRPATGTRAADRKAETSFSRQPRASTADAAATAAPKPWQLPKTERQKRAQHQQQQHQGLAPHGPSLEEEAEERRRQREEDVESPLLEEGDEAEGERDSAALEEAAPEMRHEPPRQPMRAWNADFEEGVDGQLDSEQQGAEASPEPKPRRRSGGIAFSVSLADPPPSRRLSQQQQSQDETAAALRETVERLKQEQQEMRTFFESSLQKKDEELRALWSAVHRLEDMLVAASTTTTSSTPSKPSSRRRTPAKPASSTVPTAGPVVATPRSSWEQAVSLLGTAGQQQGPEPAFKRVLAANDADLLLRLMEMAGPAALESMSEETRAELFNQITPYILDSTLAVAVLPWVEQALDLPPLPEGHIQLLCAALTQAADSPSESHLTAQRLLEDLQEKWGSVL